MNVAIKKISDVEFRVTGTVTIMQEKCKKIEVDGEIYQNIKRKLIDKNLDELWYGNREKDWGCYETDFFSKIGMPEIKMHYYGSAHTFVQSDYYKSANEYVCYLELLVEQKLLINNDFWAGTRDRYDEWRPWENKKITVELFRYGFNNGFFTRLHYSQILKLGISSFDLHGIDGRQMEKYFPEGYRSFNEKQKSELLIIYINSLSEIKSKDDEEISEIEIVE